LAQACCQASLQLQSLAEGTFTTRKEAALHVAAAFGQWLRCCLCITFVMHYSSSTDLFYIAGMRTTRSQAQEETYSSSEDEAEGASGSGNSEPNDSSPASSVAKASLQVFKACDKIGFGVCKVAVQCFFSVCVAMLVSSTNSNQVAGSSHHNVLVLCASCRLTAAILMRQETTRTPCQQTQSLITAVLPRKSMSRGPKTEHQSPDIPLEIHL